VCEKELFDKQQVNFQNNQDEQRNIKLKKKQLTFDEKIRPPERQLSIHDISLRRHSLRRKPSDSLYEIPRVFAKFRILNEDLKRANSQTHLKRPFLYEDRKLSDYHKSQQFLLRSQTLMMRKKRK